MIKYSILTLFSSYVSFYLHDYYCLTLSEFSIFITTLLYWYYPINGFRRNIDIITSSTGLIIHIYICYKKQLYYSIIGYLFASIFWPISFRYDNMYKYLHICANITNIYTHFHIKNKFILQ